MVGKICEIEISEMSNLLEGAAISETVDIGAAVIHHVEGEGTHHILVSTSCGRCVKIQIV